MKFKKSQEGIACLSPYTIFSVNHLCKGQLAKLPAILDSFKLVPQVIAYGWRSGIVGSHEVADFQSVQAKHCQMVSFVLEIHITNDSSQ